MELILGSQSPRRRELLGQMGLRFQVLTAEIDETKFETADPESSVRRICAAKAQAVARKISETPCHLPAAACGLILTADTIVVLDRKIMGKPHDEAEARAMLTALSGREHQVYTAFTILPYKAFPQGERRPGARSEASPFGYTGADEGSAPQEVGSEDKGPFTHCEMTWVKFRDLSPAEIGAYVATGEPMDKAGAYGIQGRGAMLVEAIRGDYFTVMGLPICQVAQALKRFGIDPLAP
ncbi:MAG: Maf family protein [Oscillospiraceae bacterium]|nr:Maf family protein [Oscillospiraceae bacterium]